MGVSSDDSIKTTFRPLAISGNLARFSAAAAAASELVGAEIRPINFDRLEEVFADLPKFRAGFNVSGRVLKVKERRNLEISLATTETMEEIPDEGPCEMTIIVRDPVVREEMSSSLNDGDLIEVRGKVVPFAYSEDDGERVVCLTLVASNINVLEHAQR